MKPSKFLRRARGSEPTESLESRHIPLIVTPLLDEADERLSKLSSHPVSIFSADEHEPIFKHRHESSTIELFYDLFFVANLATFTVNHEIVSGQTFRSYLGFFSLLWATWLQTSLFDVRFANDSVFLRICKAIHFGCQIGFVLAGAVYSTDPASADPSSFETLAIVQMISRLTLVIQYGSVLWYVKGYSRTRVPFLAIMAILFAAAMVYLGTYFGFSTAGSKTYYAWYITAPIEVVLCMIVSSVWRVLSFKHTHLVERVGLLTLIVMGEGILGLSKSVSYLLQSSSTVSARHAGVLISSTLLIYFIWMLYFDQIQNNRFGTIKQQVWALLHYPLHLCILFTVEGSTNLFIWVIVAPLYRFWVVKLPTVETAAVLNQIWPTSTDFYNFVDTSLKDLSTKFKDPKTISKYYDYGRNVTAIQNVTAPYGTEEWLNEAGPLVTGMWQGVGNAIFAVFGVYAPETKDSAISSGTTANVEAETQELFALGRIFDVVFLYFYIAAGLFLVVLSLLYVIGNKRKTAGEWAANGFRVFAGIGITMTTVGIRYGNVEVTGNFIVSPWHVIIVMLVYLLVITVDNIVVELAVHKRRHRRNNLDLAEKESFMSGRQAV